jgi:hypothetical protein
MVSSTKAQSSSITVINDKIYCFSGVDNTYVEKLFRDLVLMESSTIERKISLFGRLDELQQGEIIKGNSLDLLSHELKQTCLRMGLIQSVRTGLKCNIHFCIDLVIYKCTSREDHFCNKVSTLVFPELAMLPEDYHHPFFFFGEGLNFDGLYDDTEESRSSGLRVRSLPFGIYLLPSSRPVIAHRDMVTTYCYIPASRQQSSILLQTIHYFPRRNNIPPITLAPDILLKKLIALNHRRPKVLKILQAAKNVQDLVFRQYSLHPLAPARNEHIIADYLIEERLIEPPTEHNDVSQRCITTRETSRLFQTSLQHQESNSNFSFASSGRSM